MTVKMYQRDKREAPPKVKVPKLPPSDETVLVESTQPACIHPAKTAPNVDLIPNRSEPITQLFGLFS